jgi:predicted flavoprotein YhiN
VSTNQFDAIVLGAGAAGLMCAAVAGQRGRRVLLLDHADQVGKKILISGGGRCNFTNVNTAPDRFLSANPHFAKSALARYTPTDFIALVERYGIAYHEKTLGQLFCDGSAKQIVAMLLEECAKGEVDVRTGQPVSDVTHADGKFTVRFGNASFSAPALVPLTLGGDDVLFRELSGIAAPVEARAGKAAFREAALFTHRGLSGPAILQVSSYWRHGDPVTIDFLPDAPQDWLLDAKRTRPRATVRAALGAMLPDRLAETLAERLGLPGELAAQTDRKLADAESRLARWDFRPNGTEGFAKAEVTVGGISTASLSSQTMVAKTVANLYAVGEAVDVTGWLGGYNFQWAWASGHAAGQVI